MYIMRSKDSKGGECNTALELVSHSTLDDIEIFYSSLDFEPMKPTCA